MTGIKRFGQEESLVVLSARRAKCARLGGRGVAVGGAARGGDTRQPGTPLQGGVMATLCDVAMAENAAYDAGIDRFFVTIGLDAQCVAPARAGAWVEVRAQATRIFRSAAFMSARLTEGETILMVANGIFRASAKRSPEGVARLREGHDVAPQGEALGSEALGGDAPCGDEAPPKVAP